MSQLNPNSIVGSGIILIRREDPLNLFISYITNQAYSIMGFYYLTTISGKSDVCLILSDFQGIIACNKTSFSHRLNDWSNDPLVTDIIISSLKPIAALDPEFSNTII